MQPAQKKIETKRFEAAQQHNLVYYLPEERVGKIIEI